MDAHHPLCPTASKPDKKCRCEYIAQVAEHELAAAAARVRKERTSVIKFGKEHVTRDGAVRAVLDRPDAG